MGVRMALSSPGKGPKNEYASARGFDLAVQVGNHRKTKRLTGWVSRTARLRAPATQPMKGVAREGRGTSFADLTVSSGGS
jgi:hypothetical protein